MYKSSVWRTYYYRYGTVPVFIGIFLFFYLLLDSEFNVLFLFFALILLWATIWTAFFIFRLRVVTATLDGLLVRHSKINIEKIDYRNILWIYQPLYINPSIVIFKYLSDGTRKERTILFINRFDSNTFPSGNQERTMLRFIRFQIGKVNPDYQSANEPSRTSLAILKLMSMIIVVFVLGLLISIL